MRSFGGGLLGGIAGGMLGGMLFRGMGGGMGGGFGGSGIGIFEIILLAGIGYLIYKMFFSNRGAPTESVYTSAPQTEYRQESYLPPVEDEITQGLSWIRRMDTSFDEDRFKENITDIFFKIQSSWMNRNLAPVSALMVEKMKKIMQDDVNDALRDKKTNHLENVAVRKVEITEAWQEAGEDFITACFTANLLDYTTDDATGAVAAGSKTDPVKFEENWTFTRKVGNNPWQLSAINQIGG